jgi:predicted GTPase
MNKINDKTSSKVDDEQYVTDVFVVGNPGVGKSTILSSITGVQFKSGISFARGLTSPRDVDFKESPRPIWRNYRFVDTAGLADVEREQEATEALAKELKESARLRHTIKIVFVITLESGRIRHEEISTINQVMGSIELPNGCRLGHNDCMVIINKCSFLDYPQFVNYGKQKIMDFFQVQSTQLQFSTDFIQFLHESEKLRDEENKTEVFKNLVENIQAFPGIDKISSVRT